MTGLEMLGLLHLQKIQNPESLNLHLIAINGTERLEIVSYSGNTLVLTDELPENNVPSGYNGLSNGLDLILARLEKGSDSPTVQ